jgi:hypothetical protein
VIRALRRLAAWPIAERERHRLFALSAAVVLSAAGVLFAWRPGATDAPKTAPPPAARPDLARPTPPATERPGSPLSPAPGSAEDAGKPAHRTRGGVRRRPPAGPARHVAERVESAARRFLGAYLPFLYGRGPARAIAPTTAELRARLARACVRVPAAARQRYPRVVALRPRTAGGGRFAVSARVDDGGGARYPIELVVARRGGRWRVVEAGGH